MRLNRSIGSLVAFVLAVGPFGTATVQAQTAPSVPAASPIPDATAAATTASINGTARDGVGNPLPGATITITGPVTLSATADPNGRYSFPNVPPGLYSATGSKPGFSSASNSDVTVVAGPPTPLDVTLVAESLSSLRTIASTHTGSSRSTFNTSGLSVSTLNGAAIQERDQPNLDEELSELPGVTSSQSSGGRTPNSAFVVRGSEIETKTTIDGHVLTNGNSGDYFAQYANSLIFDQVEVLKGAGLDGVNAGESGVGTVNLRTHDFTAKDTYQVQYGDDSFNAQFYQALFSVNLLKDKKLSLLAASVVTGNNGPNYGFEAPNINTAGIPPGQLGATSGVPIQSALVQWQGNFSDTFATRAQLLKARYRFSQSTSITAQFLGLQGLYEPQGGSYGYQYGDYTLAQCSNGSGRQATFTGACTAASTYTDPKYFGAVGTSQELFGYFPNSEIRNNEPQFSAEFRTTLKNDTILLRPYTAVINRFIDGTLENTQPGYGGGAAIYPTGSAIPNGTVAPNPGWYQVTNSANCTSQFSYGHSATGVTNADGSSSGPCFTTQNTTSAYVGSGTSAFPVVYKTTGTNPGCSVANPCYTTETNQGANGAIGFNTQYTTQEVDHLHGTTFSYLHPVKDDLYTLSLDYSSDDTNTFLNDTSPLPAGCFGVVTSHPNVSKITYKNAAGMTVTTANPYYQPACQINGTILPNLPLSTTGIPPTQDRRLDWSGTALLQLMKNLQFGAGLYYSQQRFYYQATDPTAAANAALVGQGGAEPAIQTLDKGYQFNHHVDPHFQLAWRPLTQLSIRGNAGSSVTFPYAALVSGFSQLNLSGGAGGTTDTLNTKNPKLQPETVVAYDLGADYRLPEGSVVSVDAFDNTVHNVFITETLPLSTPTLTLPPNYNENIASTFNGPIERSYGLETTIQKAPVVGMGYRFDAGLDRAFYEGIPYSFYTTTAFSPVVNGKQLDGTTGFTSQIPYFKARGEVSYAAPSQKYNILFGDAFYGNNNGTGGPPYFNAYATFGLKLNNHLSFQASGQNIFNYSSGTFLGDDAAYAGFEPIGAKAGPNHTLIYGPAYTSTTGGHTYLTPNAISVVAPRTIYFSLTAHQ